MKHLTLDVLFLFRFRFTHYLHYASIISFRQPYYLDLFLIHVDVIGEIGVGLYEVDLEDPSMK